MCPTRYAVIGNIITKNPQVSSWGSVDLLTASTRFYKEVDYFRRKSKTIFVTPRRWSNYNPVFSVDGAPNLHISSSMCSRDSRRMRMSVSVWMVIGFSVLAANARASRRVTAAASRESLTGVVRVMVGEIIFILRWETGISLPKSNRPDTNQSTVHHQGIQKVRKLSDLYLGVCLVV